MSKKKTCKWKHNRKIHASCEWSTGCGESAFLIVDIGSITFCPYCGGKIEVDDEAN